MVATVMDTPAQAVAGSQVVLIAIAVDIVQQNQAGPIAKVGIGLSRYRLATANLLTHHGGIFQTPVVITDRAPVALVIDLHPSLAMVCSSDQTDCTISCNKKKQGETSF